MGSAPLRRAATSPRCCLRARLRPALGSLWARRRRFDHSFRPHPVRGELGDVRRGRRAGSPRNGAPSCHRPRRRWFATAAFERQLTDDPYAQPRPKIVVPRSVRSHRDPTARGSSFRYLPSGQLTTAARGTQSAQGVVLSRASRRAGEHGLAAAILRRASPLVATGRGGRQ